MDFAIILNSSPEKKSIVLSRVLSGVRGVGEDFEEDDLLEEGSPLGGAGEIDFLADTGDLEPRRRLQTLDLDMDADAASVASSTSDEIQPAPGRGSPNQGATAAGISQSLVLGGNLVKTKKQQGFLGGLFQRKKSAEIIVHSKTDNKSKSNKTSAA